MNKRSTTTTLKQDPNVHPAACILICFFIDSENSQLGASMHFWPWHKSLFWISRSLALWYLTLCTWQIIVWWVLMLLTSSLSSRAIFKSLTFPFITSSCTRSVCGVQTSELVALWKQGSTQVRWLHQLRGYNYNYINSVSAAKHCIQLFSTDLMDVASTVFLCVFNLPLQLDNKLLLLHQLLYKLCIFGFTESDLQLFLLQLLPLPQDSNLFGRTFHPVIYRNLKDLQESIMRNHVSLK